MAPKAYAKPDVLAWGVCKPFTKQAKAHCSSIVLVVFSEAASKMVSQSPRIHTLRQSLPLVASF